MKPLFIYCYDAYCGWCFAFSNVMKKIVHEYAHVMDFDVYSGGMILPETPVHISVSAPLIQKFYKQVEAITDARFGNDYLWHINHPEESDWYPNSEKPAIALCIFREYYPDLQVQLAQKLQQALFVEGRDLTDNEAYRHLLDQYQIPAEEFFTKLNDSAYKEKAYYDFAAVKQLQVSGYPTAFIQTGDLKFEMVARGYTDHQSLKARIDGVLKNLNLNSSDTKDQ